MSITIEQILKEVKNTSKEITNEFGKKILEGKDDFERIKKTTEFLHNIIKKYQGDPDFAFLMEAARLAVEKLEPDKEKAKKLFLEFKLIAYHSYIEPVPENKLEEQIKKLISAKKVKEIRESLSELKISVDEYHKTQILNLFKDIQIFEKNIYNIFKNNRVNQYKSSVLELATYVELLLKISISYKFGKTMKIYDDQIKDYLSNHVVELNQYRRIKAARKIGLLKDDDIYKRLDSFNKNRNKYIHGDNLNKDSIYPYILYADGRLILEFLKNSIIENLPDYIVKKKCSADELIKKLEKESKEKQKKYLKKMKESLKKK